MKAEIQRRQSNVEKLRAFFEAHSAEWINAVDLEPIAGRQAWRTRVSELRRRLERAGEGTIENRQRHAMALERDDDGTPARLLYGPIISEYRYLPHTPLGRDAATEIPQTWDRGPYTPEFKLTPP